jgi:hypothetical protein
VNQEDAAARGWKGNTRVEHHQPLRVGAAHRAGISGGSLPHSARLRRQHITPRPMYWCRWAVSRRRATRPRRSRWW